MKQKVYRVYLPEDLFIKYKVLCVENKLSMPKQTQALIRNFMDIQEENKKRMQGAK